MLGSKRYNPSVEASTTKRVTPKISSKWVFFKKTSIVSKNCEKRAITLMNFNILKILKWALFKTNGNIIKSNGIAAINSVQFFNKNRFLLSESISLVMNSIIKIIHKAVSKTTMP